MMIPVEGHKHLYRDEKSGAIVSSDSQGYLQYKKMREQRKYQENEIHRLREEIDELKSLISGLINKSS